MCPDRPIPAPAATRNFPPRRRPASPDGRCEAGEGDRSRSADGPRVGAGTTRRRRCRPVRRARSADGPDRHRDHGERRVEGPPPAGRVRGPGPIGHCPIPAPAGIRPGTSPRREAISRGGGSRPVSRVLSGAAIHLRRTSPCACSDLPGSGAGHASPPDGGSLPYLVLLRMGFALPPVLPPARCALTAPFHPCRVPSRTRGGLFSVALSVGSRPPGVTWHPALRSPDFPPPRRSGQRLPGRLPPEDSVARGRQDSSPRLGDFRQARKRPVNRNDRMLGRPGRPRNPGHAPARAPFPRGQTSTRVRLAAAALSAPPGRCRAQASLRALVCNAG